MAGKLSQNRYLQKVAAELFGESSQKDQFIESFDKPHQPEKAAIWLHERAAELPSPVLPRTPFQPHFVDRPSDGSWGQHHLHDDGAYYLLDLSSIFCANALSQISKVSANFLVTNVLDVCASPGGKSIFSWRTLAPRLLISNETIRSRTKALISNLSRCNVHPAVVASSDSTYFGNEFEESFDVVVVDAPCSGQSLPLKGIKNDGAFHPLNVRRNAQRQKKIIAHSGKSVAPGGYLLYMTCTFSPEENEGVASWFLDKFPEFRAVPLQDADSYELQIESRLGARLFPFSNIGAGGYSVLFRKDGEQSESSHDVLQLHSEFHPIWESSISDVRE